MARKTTGEIGMKSEVATYSGFMSTWTDPPPLDDFLVQLGRVVRWGGGTTEEWTVLQHSLLAHNVAEVMDPEVSMHCLLHDFAEIRIGDIPSPAKWKGYEALEKRFVEITAAKLGLRLAWSDSIWKRVHVVDTYCADIERSNLTLRGQAEGEWRGKVFIADVLRMRNPYTGGSLRYRVRDLIDAAAGNGKANR